MAKEISDLDKKRSIISQLKKKVCGEKTERTVCCPQETSSPEKENSAGERGEKSSLIVLLLMHRS